MQKSKNAFTMIELVFVIVILGILAAVALPKFAATRTDAQISKGRADIASIRSAIVTERQSRLITGSNGWITKLHSSGTSYFDGNGSSTLLMYGITPKDADGNWYGQGTSGNTFTYKYKLEGGDNTFAYNPTAAAITVTGTSVPSGGFVCVSGARCSELTE